MMAAHERPRVSSRRELRDLQSFFDNHFRNDPLRQVLDVGAGFTLPLDIPRSAHLVALDIDPAALARNENADEKILADVHDLASTELTNLDAVICWWVLEHLREPGDAVAQMARLLRPRGLLIIGVPNYWSFKALATKFTPFWFHVYIARRDDPLAGSAGRAPYPTYLRRQIAPKGLDDLAARNHLVPVYEQTYTLRPEERLPLLARAVWLGAGNIVRVATAGRYQPLLSEHIAIYERQ
jgi:SAM-dependent methyltransferase